MERAERINYRPKYSLEDGLKETMGFEDVRIISLGGTVKMPPLKQTSASLRFALCDFSKEYDFFIFSGNWAHFAARRHKPNIFNCRTTYSTSAGASPRPNGSAACGRGSKKVEVKGAFTPEMADNVKLMVRYEEIGNLWMRETNINAGRMKRNLEHGKSYQAVDAATIMKLKAVMNGQRGMLRK